MKNVKMLITQIIIIMITFSFGYVRLDLEAKFIKSCIFVASSSFIYSWYHLYHLKYIYSIFYIYTCIHMLTVVFVANWKMLALFPAKKSHLIYLKVFCVNVNRIIQIKNEMNGVKTCTRFFALANRKKNVIVIICVFVVQLSIVCTMLKFCWKNG